MEHHIDRALLVGESCRRTFADRVALGTAPGASWAVFVSGRVVAGGGEGVRTPGGAAVTADTAFRIASCTKSVTAAAALRARDAGLLDLAAPIDEYVELGPCTGNDGVVPTVDQLLSMNGGLPSDDPWADRQEAMARNDFDALVGAGLRFARRPGVQFEYSNTGFALVGAAIERVTGRAFRDVVEQDLLRPGGFDGIGFDPELSGVDGVAVGHRKLDDRWLGLPVSAPGAFSPIGGLFASATGLARWAGWLAAANGAAQETDGAALSAAARRELQEPVTPAGPGARSYGRGLVVEDGSRGRIVSHSGGYPGFGAHMRWHAATGIGVLGLENARYSAPVAAVTGVLDALLDALVIPAELPELWPETVAARDSVEQLLRRWDPAAAAELFADNVDADEALPRRRSDVAALAAAVDLPREPVPLEQASPLSTSPATLTWTSPGSAGLVRCRISLTPQHPPRVQTLDVQRL